MFSSEFLEQYKKGKRLFSDIILQYVDISDADLSGIIIKDSKLFFATFRNCKFANSKFVNCEIIYGSFYGGNFENSVFDSSSIDATLFQNIVTKNMKIERSKIIWSAILDSAAGEVDTSSSSTFKFFTSLSNLTEKDIVLGDWFLDDVLEKGSKRWKIPAEKIIPANGFLVLTGESWKLAFNNDGDDVHLLLPDGRTAASLTYPKLKSGMAFARVVASASGAFHCITATATPGAYNVCEDPVVAAKASVKKSSTPKKPKEKSVKAAVSKAKPKKQPVRYKNVLSGAAEPELPAIPEKLLRLKALVAGESAQGYQRPVDLLVEYEVLASVLAFIALMFIFLTAVFLQKRL